MKYRSLTVTVLAAVPCLVLATLFAGCGGHSQTGTNLQPGRTAEVVLTIDWNRTRLIPPETTSVLVTITGDGLANPVTDSISRPANQNSVSKVYQLPVGFKRITAQAKDASDRTLASGTAQTYLSEGQRADVEIVMAEVATRSVLVRIRGNAPTFVAFQDGDGAWQAVPVSGTEYRLTVNDPARRYGIVMVHEQTMVGGPPIAFVYVLHATIEELPEVEYVPEAPEQTGQVAVTGTVQGITAPEYAEIAMGSGRGTAFAYFGYSYSLYVSPGTYDLCASRFSGTHGGSADKLFIRRDVTVAGDATIDIDFNSADAFALQNKRLTVQGMTGDGMVVVNLLTNRGSMASLQKLYQVTTTDIDMATVPTDKLQGNDIHQLMVTGFEGGTYREVIRYFKSVDSLTVTLPPPLGTVSVRQVAITPYLRLQMQWEAYPGAQGYFTNISSSIPRSRARGRTPEGSSWNIALSIGWLGAQTSYTIPDLSSVTGWNNAWGPQSTGYIEWNLSAFSTSGDLLNALVHESNPADGLEIRMASQHGTLGSE